MGEKFKNKVVIVTGGATFTGAAISKKFAAEGAKVVVSGFCDEPVDRVVDEITSNGGTAIGYKADLSTEIKARECVTLAVNTWGSLDVLISAAGVFPSMEEMQYYPLEAFYFMMRNNIQTAFMMTRFALPELQKSKGAIVFTGADVGNEGLPGNAPYGGTKGFIHAFSKGLAAEQKKYGVRVNCICNSPIDQDWVSSTRSRESREENPETKKVYSPEEIADVYLFLSGRESAHLNGILYSPEENVVKDISTNKKVKSPKPGRKPAGRKSTNSGKKRPAHG